jgi:hypothetical protein
MKKYKRGKSAVYKQPIVRVDSLLHEVNRSIYQ